MKSFATCLALLTAQIAAACSLCEGGFRSAPTLRQEAAQKGARMILHGTAVNPRLKGDGLRGETDFVIKGVLRDDPAIKGKKQIVLPRYLPVADKDSPPQFLLFCDVDRAGVDPYRGIPIRGSRTVEYFKKALALDPKDTAGNLPFFFGYLHDEDPEVARDAFLEFARADDASVLKAGPKLDADKLRAWLKDPKTPKGRHALYAMLLGASGKPTDAALLRSLLDSKEERYQDAADGLLAGYITIEPKKGWDVLHGILSDGRKPLSLRIKAISTLRFFHLGRPKESRADIVKAMKSVIVQGDLADMAIEDLRAFKLWDLTPDVLNCWGTKGFDSPLMRRAMLRYALSCEPTPASKAFVAARKADSPDEVKDVAEGLRLERE